MQLRKAVNVTLKAPFLGRQNNVERPAGCAKLALQHRYQLARHTVTFDHVTATYTRHNDIYTDTL